MQRSLCAVLIGAVLLGAVACAGPGTSGERASLQVVAATSGAYRCADGGRIFVTYYHLSDNSLHFVKIVFPGGKEYTLPNVVSASGARYTDEREFVWWAKGKTAFVQARDSEGRWYTKANDCRRVNNDR